MVVALVHDSRKFDGHYLGHFSQYRRALEVAGIPHSIYRCVDPSLESEYPSEGTLVLGRRIPGGGRLEMAFNRFFPVFARKLERAPESPVHANDVYLGRLAQYRSDVVVTVADLAKLHTRFYDRGASWIHNFELRYVRRARAIVCHTETGRADVIRSLGVSPEKVFVVPHHCPFPLATPRADRAWAPPTRDRPWRLLWVGTDRPNKNLPAFVQVIEILDNRFRGVVVSHLGPSSRRLLRESTGGGRIEVVEQVPDMLPVYRSAHVLVFPSLYEGFGLPLLEAMSQGVPVIASTRSCTPEVVADGGILLDPGRPEAWAAEVLRLGSDGEYAAASARALRRARAFPIEGTSDALRVVYESIARQ